MGKYKKHDADRIFFEYLVKDMLQNYKLVDDDFRKDEKPDFQNDNTGLEVTRADETLAFGGATLEFDKDRIKNIEKFNKKFRKLGGRVFRKTDPLVRVLGLRDTFGYHKDYVYIAPSYQNGFSFINKKIKDKIEKLNSEYVDLEHYYLGIFSPAYIAEDKIKQELGEIVDMQSGRNKKFEKVMIVFVDKICTFDMINNVYSILKDTNKKLNEISTRVAKRNEGTSHPA